jgi:hypothetical protein
MPDITEWTVSNGLNPKSPTEDVVEVKVPQQMLWQHDQPVENEDLAGNRLFKSLA